MTYKISDAAEADLLRILKYGVKNFGETQSDKYFWAIMKQIEFITELPMSFPTIDLYGKKYHICATLPDTIYYYLQADNTVMIDRILGRQDRNQVH